MPEEEFECPECGVDIRTGDLTKRARLKRDRKGPDPAEYYRTAWTDAWQFLTKHRSLAARTSVYLVSLLLMHYGCGFMMLWCSKIPLKVFWGALAFMALMAAPGWLWHLNLEVIRGSMTRKFKPKDVKFDFFQCVALGISAVIWLFVFSLPFLVVFGGLGAVLIVSDMELAGYIVTGLAYLPVILLMPIAMAHMCMPVTWPGWVSPKLLPSFFRTAAPALYWALILFVTMIPTIALNATSGALYADDVETFVSTVGHNARIERAQDMVEERDEVDEGTQSLAQETLGEVDFQPMIVPLVLTTLSWLTLGIAAVYSMRANGQFVYYFRRDLDLITLSKEVKYVKKEQKVDEFGEPVAQGAAMKVVAGVGGTILFYAVANVIVYFATGGDDTLLPRPLAQLLNIIE